MTVETLRPNAEGAEENCLCIPNSFDVIPDDAIEGESTNWTTPDNACDENTGTYASITIGVGLWSNVITLTLPSSQDRANIGYVWISSTSGANIDKAKFQFYNGSWLPASPTETVISGRDTWLVASTATDLDGVTKIRCQFKNNGAGIQTLYLAEIKIKCLYKNYTLVDEVSKDDDTTCIQSATSSGFHRDLYNLADSVGTEIISKVTVKAYMKKEDDDLACYTKLVVKAGSTVSESANKALTTTYALYTEDWTTNPDDSEVWEWGDIDALQAGVSLYYATSEKTTTYSRCTQLWIEVESYVITPKTGDDSGTGTEHYRRIHVYEKATLLAFILGEDAGVETEINSFLSRLFRESGTGADLVVHLIIHTLDSGTGADLSLLVATLDALDSATGIELVSQVDRILKDSGLSVELSKVLLYGLDSGTGTGLVSSALSLLSALDSATGVEVLSNLIRILRESASGTDLAQIIFADRFGLDEGAGEGLSTLLSALVAQDEGSTIQEGFWWSREYAYLIALLDTLDSATGSDLLRQFDRILEELASGVDLAQLVFADWFALESGTGTDLPTLLATLDSLDTGTGAEVSFLINLVLALDSALGTDISTPVQAILEAVESGTGTDLSTLLAVFTALDKGAGVDLAPYGITISVTDSGTGTDLKTALLIAILAKMLVSILSKASMLVGTESKAKMDIGIDDKVRMEMGVDKKASLNVGVDKKSKIDVSLLGGGSQ